MYKVYVTLASLRKAEFRLDKSLTVETELAAQLDLDYALPSQGPRDQASQ